MRQAFALPTLAISAVFALSACSGDDVTGPTAQTGSAPASQPAAPVSIDVAVRTTGDGLDPDGYSLGVDGQFYEVGVQELRTIDGLAAGSHTLWLADVAENCELSGPAILRFDIAAGGAAQADFRVECRD
jgi:hypothetical protein